MYVRIVTKLAMHHTGTRTTGTGKRSARRRAVTSKTNLRRVQTATILCRRRPPRQLPIEMVQQAREGELYSFATPNANPGHIRRPAPNGRNSTSAPRKSTLLPRNLSRGSAGCRRRVSLTTALR